LFENLGRKKSAREDSNKMKSAREGRARLWNFEFESEIIFEV
jgi:hypothetical protein